DAAELPGVVHVADHLPLVGIARTGVDPDPAILVAYSSGAAKVRNKNLPPVRIVAARHNTGFVPIHNHGKAHLLEIVVTVDLSGLVFGVGEGGQKQSSKDGDDRDHDEKFDQSESFLPKVSRSRTHSWVEL